MRPTSMPYFAFESTKACAPSRRGFLAIGEQEHHRPCRRVLLQQVRHFQPDGDADAVIAKAGAGFDAVIVRGKHESGAIA
jgi:hypothetical protein